MISTTDMTYTRSQNYTNMVVGEHEIQTFVVVVVMLLLLLLLSVDVFVPILSAHPLLFFNKWLVQKYLNVRFLEYLQTVRNLVLIALIQNLLSVDTTKF